LEDSETASKSLEIVSSPSDWAICANFEYLSEAVDSLLNAIFKSSIDFVGFEMLHCTSNPARKQKITDLKMIFI
jgi:hypothetical protein